MRALLLAGASLGLVAGATVASCLKTAAFNCATDTQCGTGGVCEPEGVCSIADSGCPSGRRFDTSAGGRAGECVGEGTPIDGPADVDGAIDMPIDQPMGCQAGYDTVTGGQANHKYKLVTAAAPWDTQENAVCATSGGYLMIPDSVGELTAVFGLDQGNNGDMWVGVEKPAGAVVDVLGNAYNAIAVSGFNGGNKCAKTTNGTTLTADGCGSSFIAACECDEP